MGIFARRAPALTQTTACYHVFRERMNELQVYIENQMKEWGSWENIPDNIKVFIDREFVKLGKFGKRIDIHSLEKTMHIGTS